MKKYGKGASDPNSAFVVSNKFNNPCLENSKSFDFGIEKNFPDFGLNFEANFFNIEYEDVLEGWEDGTSSGLAYTTQNMPGKVKSKGLEFSSNWKKDNFLNFGLNYTFTSTYDGAEADDPNRNQNFTNNQMVRAVSYTHLTLPTKRIV